jgi:hypothetical protein
MKRKDFFSLKNRSQVFPPADLSKMNYSFLVDRKPANNNINLFQLTQLLLCIMSMQRKIHENTLRRSINDLIHDYTDQKAAKVEKMLSLYKNINLISTQNYLLLRDKYKDPYYLELELMYSVAGIRQEVAEFSSPAKEILFMKK